MSVTVLVSTHVSWYLELEPDQFFLMIVILAFLIADCFLVIQCSSIAGTKMIPPPSNKAPQTSPHLPHPTTMRYSDFLDFSWGPAPKV